MCSTDYFEEKENIHISCITVCHGLGIEIYEYVFSSSLVLCRSGVILVR
jgi:hypothetical protein